MRWLMIAASVLAAACGQTTAGSAAGDVSNDTTAARAAVVKLEAEAKALARTDGCSGAEQCREAPVGDRACGGPRLYIPYCAAATDSSALFKKLSDVKAADQKLNKLTNAASTCEYRMPPAPSFVGGHCGP